jgi:SH3 domain protein
MKQLHAVCIMTLIFFTTAHAETLFVKDMMEITFRTGPGTEHKIIAMLKSGQSMEVVESGTGWTKARLPNGREGWVLTRLVSPEPPASLISKNLKEKNEEISRQSAILLEENTQIKEEKQKLIEELAATKTLCDEITRSYEDIKKGSAEYLNLKKNHEKIQTQLVEQNRTIEQLKNRLAGIQSGHAVRWFLSGAGVLLVGFFIGFIVKKQRRRSTLL